MEAREAASRYTMFTPLGHAFAVKIASSMYDSALRKAFEVRRFTIRQRGVGWEVLEESQDQVVNRLVLRDWHRVERALAKLKTREESLRQQGWQKSA